MPTIQGPLKIGPKMGDADREKLLDAGFFSETSNTKKLLANGAKLKKEDS